MLSFKKMTLSTIVTLGDIQNKEAQNNEAINAEILEWTKFLDSRSHAISKCRNASSETAGLKVILIRFNKFVVLCRLQMLMRA